MSDYTVIADVSESLTATLRTEFLADQSLAPKFTDAGSITLAPPVDDPQELGAAALSIYLYRILEDAHLKNQTYVPGTGGRLRRPPLTLDLFYLITPLLKEPKDQQIVLGKVMQVLYDRSTLEGPDLGGGLASDDRVRVIFNPVSLEEAARVWQALETTYRLSVCYMLRVALLDSTREVVGTPVAAAQAVFAGR